MQLIFLSLAFFLLVVVNDVKAQIQKNYLSDSSDKLKSGHRIELDSTIYPIIKKQKPIEIDILSSYYSQDGNNSPVTGGIGTEQLTDFTSKLILKLPINEKLSVNADAGFDYYTSASTDNIDFEVSSDSQSDTRIHGNVGVSYDWNDRQTLGARIGGSSEYDYISISGGLDYSLLSKDKNTTVGLSLQAFIDQWDIIYPQELRNQNTLPTDKRQSYNASLSISRVLNKKMQMSFQLEAIYMNGLLSTPFHRVYFQDQDKAGLEILPSTRLKIPLGVRFNYHIHEKIIARLYYRYYWDDWGVNAHTTSVELPIKFNRFLSVYPFYRFHKQTASDYFKPYREHVASEEFRTSDFDLAALHSHSYGFGVRWSPVNGIARMKLPFKKRNLFMVKSVDLKYSHYDRSTGLKANIISIGISFKL